MTDDELMLLRALGQAVAEDHVAWAVRRLEDGHDTPSLRVLAGLDPVLERDDVGPYFRRSVEEAGLELPSDLGEPRSAAALVRRLYEAGARTATETIAHMSELHRRSGYADPVLGVWHDVEEELLLSGSGHEGVFYPLSASGTLDEVVEREWRLFEEALALDLPADFDTFVRCDACGFVGPAHGARSPLAGWVTRLWPRARRPSTVRWTCGRCGWEGYRGISDPRAREAWFAALRAARGPVEEDGR